MDLESFSSQPRSPLGSFDAHGGGGHSRFIQDRVSRATRIPTIHSFDVTHAAAFATEAACSGGEQSKIEMTAQKQQSAAELQKLVPENIGIAMDG